VKRSKKRHSHTGRRINLAILIASSHNQTREGKLDIVFRECGFREVRSLGDHEGITNRFLTRMSRAFSSGTEGASVMPDGASIILNASTSPLKETRVECL